MALPVCRLHHSGHGASLDTGSSEKRGLKNPLDMFEGTLSAMSPEGFRESPSAGFLRFKKVVPLFPGTYRLELAIKASETGNVGTLYKAITVP